MLGEGAQIVDALELNFACIGLGASGDEVEEGGFTCAVWSDDGAEFTFFEVEVEVADGLEAVK